MKSTLFCAALSTVGLASILWASQPNQAPRIDTASCAGKAGCTVSFELIDNRIFVPVWINGQGPFHILFDTGAGAGVSMEVAEKLKLPHESDIEGGGVGSGTIKGYSSHLKSAAIGARASGERASVEDIEIEVLPLNDSPAVFGKVPLDGFMGFPFYEKYVIEHDYTAKKLTFRDPRTFTYSGHGVQLDIESTSYVPLVDGTLDGMPGKFGIDTGARSSLLLYGPYVASHGLREKYKPKFEGVTGWGIGGPVRSEIARIGGVGLGGIEIHDVVARFSLNKSGATAGSSKAGLIGPDILKQFTLICDYSRKKLIRSVSSCCSTTNRLPE